LKTTENLLDSGYHAVIRAATLQLLGLHIETGHCACMQQTYFTYMYGPAVCS